MQLLKKKDFINDIIKFAASKPMLGICLDMQMLSTTGNEFGKINGLNLIQGKMAKLLKKDPLSTNVGWMKIVPNIQHKIFNNVNFNVEFYFDHSYHLILHLKKMCCQSEIKKIFFCVINNNIFGFQFH